jgi:hypothetical protein
MIAFRFQSKESRQFDRHHLQTAQMNTELDVYDWIGATWQMREMQEPLYTHQNWNHSEI